MHCGAHVGTEASWECTSCRALWCDACPRSVGLTHHVVCATCGHALAKYAPPRTGGEVLVRSVRRAFSPEGLVTATALAIFYGALSSLVVVPVIYLSTLVTYYFVTIHHVGDGKPGLPGPSETVDNWTEIRVTAFAGLVTAVLGFLPLIVVLAKTHASIEPRMMLALVLLGQLYMPAIILAVAVTNSPWAALWPPTWARVVARAPGPYVRFVSLWVLSVVVGLAVLLGTLRALTGSMVGDAAAAFVWNVFWFFQASIVGEYVRSNAAVFGLED